MSLIISLILLFAFVSIIWAMKKRQRVNTELEALKAHLENMVDERTQELTLSNKQLQEEIVKRERAQEALRQAKDAAESANRAKSDYLANLTHELRTPLNAILGFSQLLERSPDANEQQREYLSIINRSGEHLLTLINDVLEMSKIEAGQIHMNMTAFNLHASIKGIEEMIHRRAEEKGLIFQVDFKGTPQHIKTDEGKFRQILINLLNNAIKFTHSGTIQLRVFIDDTYTSSSIKSRRLDIEIEDTGIGIPRQEKDSIFDPFSRISHDKYGMEGAGLGLAISKKLIELLGGNISIESKDHSGSLVRFYISYHEPDPNLPTRVNKKNMIRSVDKNWQHIQILVVEDKWENRLLLKNLLLQVGFKVLSAQNGQKAIEQFRRYHPALIFMDIRMPLMSGIEATKKIRKMPDGNTVKIIAITAHAFEEFREDILAVGCDDLIRKPYRDSDIFDSIKKHLGVTFVTERQFQIDEVKTGFTLSQKDLLVLPDNIRHTLRQATIDLDVSHFEAIVDEIRLEYPALANRLLELSSQFRYDYILDCLAM
ncbi:MAG: multi-sensor hybrid histidine kinase [Candidatus Magnetoglobus multicellularis str. Araruama]|uniref:histidine kinase n=1 Tax=Candidatus Magnetoglobus multicellularis str. Araruama TaxID=890399 RepID=A0A1V1PEP7_9BACT|nr:MAG: multi-sensor hybrid histidine kinase [Candidatus Magnetoglobus multicellularis str. Araruama]